jgi:hypothetical protein
MSDNRGQAFKSKDFKVQQRPIWDNAASGWHAWWPTLEHGVQKVSDKIVELAEIKAGNKVLDIATGV